MTEPPVTRQTEKPREPSKHRGRWSPAALGSYLTPFLVALGVLIPLYFGITYNFYQWRASLERSKVFEKINPYEQSLETALHEVEVLQTNLATYLKTELESGDLISNLEFQTLAGSLAETNPALETIIYTRDRLTPLVFPDRYGGWQSLIGGKDLEEYQRLSVGSDRPIQTRPYHFQNEPPTLALIKAICPTSQNCSYLHVVVNLDEIVQAAGLDPAAWGLQIEITNKGKQTIWGYPVEQLGEPVRLTIGLESGEWYLAAAPASGWGNEALRATAVFALLLLFFFIPTLGIALLITVQRARLKNAVSERTAELARVSQNYQILGRCNQALVRAASEDDLLREVCQGIVELGAYRLAWVESEGKVIAAFQKMEEEISHVPLSLLPKAQPMHKVEQGQPFLQADWPLNSRYQLPADQEELRGDCILLPLGAAGEPLGLLGILCAKSCEFAPSQQEVLTQLAGDLTFGIQTLRARLAHHQSESELRRQHDLFRRVMETTPSGIMVFDQNGALTLVNRKAEEFFGFSVQVINNNLNMQESHSLFRFYDNQYNPVELNNLPAAWILESGQPIRDLRGSYLNDETGETRWAILNGAPMTGEDGLEGAIISLVDITQYRETEQALIESEKRYRRLFDSVQEGIWMTDAHNRTTFVNDNMARMLGYAPSELSGRSLMDFLDTASQEIVWFNLDQARQGINHDHEVEMLHKNGSHVYTRIESSPILDDQGNFSGVMAMVADISARHRREQELEAISRMAKALRNESTRAEMTRVILEQMSLLLSASGALLISRDPESGDLTVEGTTGQWASLLSYRLAAGESATQRIMDSGQPYFSADVLTDSVFSQPDLFGSLRTVVGVPLLAHEKIIAVVWVGRGVQDDTPINQMEDIRLLMSAADIAASALHRATLHDQTELRLQRLITLRNISLNISANADMEKILEALTSGVHSPQVVSAVGVLKLQPEERKLSLVAGWGFLGDPPIGSQISLENDYSGYVIRNRRFFHLPDLPANVHGFDRPWVASLVDYQCYEALPLISKKQVKGVLEIFFDHNFRPNNEWIDFLHATATEIAIAMDNMELLEQLQRSNQDLVRAYDATIEGWSRALELRDQETEGHAQRVVDLTLKLAELCGLPPEQMQHIRRGALLHDIGKVAIPDAILFKTGPLSLEERDVMRNHPIYAYKLLSPIEYLRPALEIPYCHHEHWDGSGYPRGLAGEDIPLAARIFTLVDVWDALCSDRTYRAAWSNDEVRAYMLEQSGKILDPQVVEKFFTNILGEPPTRKTRHNKS